MSKSKSDEKEVAFYMKMPEDLYKKMKRVSDITMIPMSQICRKGVEYQIKRLTKKNDIDIDEEMKKFQ